MLANKILLLVCLNLVLPLQYASAQDEVPKFECNGEFHEIMAPAQERKATGKGSTLRDAIRDTVKFAVLDAVFERYKCSICTPRWGQQYECRKIVQRYRGLDSGKPPLVFTGGAYLKDETTACKRINNEPGRSWECRGTVVIPSDDPPWAPVGCDTCVDCDISEE